MDPDKNLSQIEGDLDYNFIRKYDEEGDVFSRSLSFCKYFEMDQFMNYFSNKIDNCQTPDLGQGLEFDFTLAMEQEQQEQEQEPHPNF